MEEVRKNYYLNIEEGKKELKRLKKVLFRFAMLRLFIFLAVIILSYLFWENLKVVGGIVMSGIILFLLFVSKFTDAKNQLAYYKKYVQINENELAYLDGKVVPFKTGDEFISDEHFYNQDIDLFGEGSLFQHICRSETVNGRKLLAFWLNSNDIHSIDKRQESIKELSHKVEWRQKYQVIASLLEEEKETDGMLQWLKNYESILPKYLRFLPLIFSIISLLLLGTYFADLLPGKYLLYWFLIGLGVTGKFVKPITNLYQNASKMQDTFAQYAQLLEAVELTEFSCETLKKQQQNIITENEKASLLLKDYTKRVEHLGQRNNLLFAPPSNGFFLWDIRSALKVERWIDDYKNSVEKWFEVIEFFDAINSLGNYAFNHSTYVYPELVSGSTQINAKNLGHPLLRKDKMVTNTMKMDKKEFFIITGANMAGKSTFLRTVALNIVMANCGLPVCAKSFSYQPIKLISSMRTSDSLQNDASYFFSELKRLKFIVEKIKTDNYLIILDEILKGTNSKDKAEGSKKFIQKLVESHSTGIVATHDLSLCTLSKELPQIKNHYFDAEIVDNELFFDYKFKDGICQNMNASFLLQKMGIV